MYSPDVNMEKALFVRIAQGDEKAFREIFDTYRTKLFSFVLQMTSAADVSEEIVQDVFLKIWTSRQKMGAVENPANYIFILTRNKTMDCLRKVATDKKRLAQLWLASSTQLAYQVSDADHKLNVQAVQQLIDEAVSRLPEQKQIIFKLSRNEGWSNEEIANHLNLSKSRVANTMVEVLKHLRSHLGKYSGDLALLLTYAILVHK
ncbi:MAG TPA: RNA polymerase sigma-70 factor [Arachidicoccus sp.]